MSSAPSPTIELGPDRPSAEIRRARASARLAFDAPYPGEAIVFLGVSAAAVDWGRPGAECAVLHVSLDGAHVSDVIAPSERAATRGVALGHVDAGPHSVTF